MTPFLTAENSRLTIPDTLNSSLTPRNEKGEPVA
jgi:hypothetical protein